MTNETRSAEEFHAAKAVIQDTITAVLNRVAEGTEAVQSTGHSLKVGARGLLIHAEIKCDTRASISWFRGKFTSVQITLDRWSGQSVRRSVKIDGLALPEAAEAKIEEKARELVAIALKREADYQAARKVADERQQLAFEARLEARDAGFSPRPRWGADAVILDGPDADYVFGEEYGRKVTVLHSRQGAKVEISLTLPADQLLTALEFAQAVYERMPK